jgi:hypothetical protein
MKCSLVFILIAFAAGCNSTRNAGPGTTMQGPGPQLGILVRRVGPVLTKWRWFQVPAV